MAWWSVQRSGRTSIRATTRSLSASTKVIPFNSANGIFIERIFSSGVIFQALLRSVISRQPERLEVTFSTDGNRDKPSFILHPAVMRQFPPRRIVCLTEETVETLYLLGEQDRIAGVSGSAVGAPQGRGEEPRV